MMQNLPQFERCIRFASLSDVGMRRKNNQDATNTLVSSDEAFWRKRGHLFLVADGMGAHAAGELASKLAADSIPHSYSKDLATEPVPALRQAMIEANETIFQRGQVDLEFQGMGTTCSTLLLLPEGAIVAHVGDSRIYRLRNGQLDQLSFDHSLVWEMQATGRVSPEAAEMHLPKNIITRSLGPNPTVQIDLEGPFPIIVGDVYLLCSDGLTGPISDQQIGTILGCMPPAEAARTLIDLANLRGGPDNISVVVVQVDHPPVAQNNVNTMETSPPNGIPFTWITAFLLSIVAIVLFVLQEPFWGVFCGIGATVAGIIAILQKFDSNEEDTLVAQPVQMFGRGPYRSYDCKPSTNTVENFANMVAELRQTAEQNGTPIEWQNYDTIIERASESIHNNDLKGGIYHYSRGISFLVAAFKNRNSAQQISDSHVDLF
jgi:serine/threonine protein phosphatase PrpC